MERCCQRGWWLSFSFFLSLPHCHPRGWQWVSTPFPLLCLHKCRLSTLNRNHRESFSLSLSPFFCFCFHWGTLHVVAHVPLSLCLCRHPVSRPFQSVMNNYIRGLMRWEMTAASNMRCCSVHWQLPGNLKQHRFVWLKQDLEWWKFRSFVIHMFHSHMQNLE